MEMTLTTAVLCFVVLEVSHSFTLRTKRNTVCNVFEETAGYALYGYNDKTLYETSLEECKTACIEMGPECLSFDYKSNTDSCFLSSESKDTKPESFGKHSQASYYHKVCLEVIEGDDDDDDDDDDEGDDDIEIGESGSGSGSGEDDCIEQHGPFGGSGGNEFNDKQLFETYGDSTGFRISYSSDLVFCFGLVREDFDNCYGTEGPSNKKISFAKGEYITGIKGREGNVIDQLTIITNKDTYGPYGGTGGSAFQVVTDNTKLAYISGKVGDLVDKITFHFYCSPEF